MSEQDNDLKCDGCGCTLELYDIEQEGKPRHDMHPIFIVPKPGADKAYCETCFTKR